MSTLGIIPARYGSSRFPGKPLVPILGKSLIQRTYENAQKCETLDELVVATDDRRIFDHVRSFGGNVVMSGLNCPTGTDRIVDVLHACRNYDSFSIIVNIQGDEPCLSPSTLQAVIHTLLLSDAEVATAVTPLPETEATSSHIVKCVMDQQGHALYFSRALIPSGKNLAFRTNVPYYRHIGLYAFKRPFLMQYPHLPPTPLQLAEDLEQLKILELGYRIKTAIVDDVSLGVDTPEDIKKVEQYLCQQSTSLSLAESSPHSAKG